MYPFSKAAGVGSPSEPINSTAMAFDQFYSTIHRNSLQWSGPSDPREHWVTTVVAMP